MRKPAALVFPHQLFKDNPVFEKAGEFFVVEEELFFNQFKFHKQKLLFHRASMKFYSDYLEKKGFKVNYIESTQELSDIRKLIPELKNKGFNEILYVDVSDNWLDSRIKKAVVDQNLKLKEFDSPLFLNSKKDVQDWFKDKSKFRQTDFYIHQRKKWNILLDENKAPKGGKWTFDTDNRKKYPKDKQAPVLRGASKTSYHKEAQEYVEKNFMNNYGSIDSDFRYPIDFQTSENWLSDFFKDRFYDYGSYQDAIVQHNDFLNHSIISPMMNVGLLTPAEVLERAIEFSDKNEIPLNSLEGFIRQILGWREFLRGLYEIQGSYERTKNYWNFNRKIPESFWNASTGILPVDDTIKRTLKTGYAHHIERLMVLGNFMLLCEFDPDEVYRWFMEMFIDAYDWVMVPNVYGMSQFADGGLMATKPYISGSNYLKKMSNYPGGDWQQIWDALFWRFMDEHRDFFLGNPRLGMLIKNFDKKSDEERKLLIQRAYDFLGKL